MEYKDTLSINYIRWGYSTHNMGTLVDNATQLGIRTL